MSRSLANTYTASSFMIMDNICWTFCTHLEIVFESHVLVEVAPMRSLEIALITSEAQNEFVRVLMPSR